MCESHERKMEKRNEEAHTLIQSSSSDFTWNPTSGVEPILTRPVFAYESFWSIQRGVSDFKGSLASYSAFDKERACSRANREQRLLSRHRAHLFSSVYLSLRFLFSSFLHSLQRLQAWMGGRLGAQDPSLFPNGTTEINGNLKWLSEKCFDFALCPHQSIGAVRKSLVIVHLSRAILSHCAGSPTDESKCFHTLVEKHLMKLKGI